MITYIGVGQIIVFILLIILLVKPLGYYIAQVYEGKNCGLNYIFGFVERLIYRLCRINHLYGMEWKEYLFSMLIFNLLGLLLAYVIQRTQGILPLNPQNLPSISPILAFNTAVSYVTNTNWQAYSGETTMSYFTQMLALTTQNFLSAATGLCLLFALIRGIAGHESKSLGNFWVDMIRSVLYILLPLSLIFSLVFVSEGVIQNLKPNQKVNIVETLSYQINNKTLSQTEQIIPMGPVASQIAIKQLGSNGGGYFNVNSSHPFENPTPLTNLLEILAMLVIPAALCYSFGIMVSDKRQGWAIFITMLIIFIPFLIAGTLAEQIGNPAFTEMGIDQNAKYSTYPGGNMEGKETRFGIVGSTIWTASTTATSNGSNNSMFDSYTPIGGLVPLVLMHLGEVIFGGVGSGLSGMLMLVIITVFVAGLMVGRTPEYLGKKIEPFEMKMASLAVLVMPVIVLLTAAIAVVSKDGVDSIANHGAHGFTEILYAFTSLTNNNGSAFSGLNSNTPFYNLLGSLVMLIGRYWIAIPTLAIAGSLVRKKIVPKSSGTLTTHTPLFITLLIGVIIIIGALSFLPACALGPVVEQLMLMESYGH